MYLEHFGLATNPFSLSPKLDFLYKSTAFEESMAHLIYGLDNSEAIVMITGAIGSGKTMALQSFMANLGGQFDFALVTNTQVGTVELLKLVLDDLGVEFPVGCDKSDLLILFKNFLFEASRHGRRVIIIIDEAQNLPLDVLEEVRLLTNLGQGESQPVQIVLVGQPELLRIVNDPGLAQLRQRIRVHYTFETLTRSELDEYLVHRMAVAGCKKPVFKPKAIDRIFELSAGVPRVVNTLAGEALLSAFVGRRVFIDAVDIEPVSETVPGIGNMQASAPVSSPVAASVPREHAADHDRAHGATGEKPRFAEKRHSKRRLPSRIALVVVVLLVVLGVVWVNPANIVTRSAELVKGLVSSLDSETKTLPILAERISEIASEPVLVGVPVAQQTTEEMETLTAASVEELESAEESESNPATVQLDQYHVHIASFKDDTRAKAYLVTIGKKGVQAELKSQIVRGDLWYRIYLGPYRSQAAAQEAIDSVKEQEKIQYYLISKIKP